MSLAGAPGPGLRQCRLEDSRRYPLLGTPGLSDSAGLERVPRIGVSSRFPGDTAAGQGLVRACASRGIVTTLITRRCSALPSVGPSRYLLWPCSGPQPPHRPAQPLRGMALWGPVDVGLVLRGVWRFDVLWRNLCNSLKINIYCLFFVFKRVCIL